MKSSFFFASFLAVIAVGSHFAEAAEPARDFLRGLRERGYHDVALDYLEAMAASRLAPVELKETIIYEKGVTLIEASRSQRDSAIREKYLDDAQKLLDQFSQQRSDHPLANGARSQLGNLIVERARMKVEQSKKGNKQQLLKEANALYEEAFKVFVALQESVRVQLERIPKVLDPKDRQQAKMIERRKQFRADYLQTQLLAAAIREEMADTYEKGSEPYNKVLEEAAGLYDEIYKKYRTRLAGLYARMYQGRANQKLAKLQDALGFYSELLDQPDEPIEFRNLKTKTLRLALEGWLHPSEKKYLEAVKRAAEWVKKSRPTDDRNTDWLAIRLSLAKAYKMQADEAEPADKRTINQSLKEARRQAQFVASKSSEFQDEAKQLVADLGGPDRTGDKPDPRNFNEARKAGQEALDSITTASLVVAQVPKRIAAEQDEAIKADLQKQLGEAQDTLATANQDAVEYYNLALTLADETTAIEDINIVRYFLCYLYYLEKDFYRSALMGDFVSRRYPDSAGARQCAKISLACYMAIYVENQDEDKEFETNHIVKVAEYIADKWPDQPEAEEALNTLVPFMINAGELDRAQAFLTRIPESSPKRGESELKTGRAMWGHYERETRKLIKAEEDGNAVGIDIAAERAKLNELKARALEILAAGYARIQESGKPDGPTEIALLALAKAHLESQQAAQGIAVLEHASLGPLTLVDKKDPSVQDPAVVEETYKTALQCYISSLGAGSGTEAIDKAKDVMAKMKAAIGGNAEGDKRLTSVYVNLAQDLETQLATATPEAKRALSQGFETFLRQLSEGATELSILNWVAESFSKLGASLDDGEQLNDDAKKYYQASLDAFQNILDKVELEGKQKIQVQLAKAGVLAQTRNFEKALGIYVEILRANKSTLVFQVDAAKMLEAWAKQPGQEQKYMDAILGVEKGEGRDPVVWGWGRIAKKTADHPKFKDTFYEARLRLAQCRFNLANSKDGAEKEKLLDSAHRDVAMTKRLFPGLGGEQRTAQYDALLKQIQTAKGDRAIGLKALETKAPDSAGE